MTGKTPNRGKIAAVSAGRRRSNHGSSHRRPPIGSAAMLFFAGLLVGCDNSPPPSAPSPASQGEKSRQPLADASPPPARGSVLPRSPEVTAGEDFYRHAVGAWLQQTPIPAGRNSYGPLTEIYDAAQKDLLALLSQPPSPDDSPTVQTLKTLFRSYTDQDEIRSRKLAPIDLKLAIIDNAETVQALLRSMARADLGAILPLRLEVRPDIASPSAFALYISQGPLGHPAETYGAPEFEQQRTGYRYDVQARLAQLGIPNARKRAEHIISLEDALAAKYVSSHRLDTPQLTYNILPPEDLNRIAPILPWPEILSEQQVEIATHVIVETPAALKRLGLAAEAAPLSVWRDFAKVRLLNHYSFVLPAAPSVPKMTRAGAIIDDQDGSDLSRPERALKQIVRQAPDALSAAYVERYGGRIAKPAVQTLIGSVDTEMGARIEALGWMSDRTRRIALQKFTGLRTKIAYPDRIMIEPLPELAEKDAFENFQKMDTRQFTIARRRLLEGNAQTLWQVRPDEPFLRYSLNRNEIIVPLALLQPPLYDADRSAAENYGALGALVAHELWHSIDARGHKADAEGFMNDWWSTSDKKQYDRRTEILRTQLTAAGLNPDLHLDEVAGDIAGLEIAYAAFLNQRRPQASDADDLKRESRKFFYAWADTMKRRYRDGEQARRLFTDPHPVASLRVNIAVRNIDPWYDAFGITPSDEMYLPPEDRFSPW